MAVSNGQAPAGIEAQLERVLSSETFRNAPRLSEFLRFSVAASLRGEADQIKEYLIGLEVFGRGSDYDPRIDPVVRVEARRLRAKLREYYEEEGRQDALRIHFPKGGYVPVFERRGDASEGPPQAPRFRLSRRGLLLAGVGAAVVLGVAGTAAIRSGWIPGLPNRLRIAVLPMRAYGPEESEEVLRLADGVAEAVLRELSRHEDLSVVSWPTVAGYRAAGKGITRVSSDLGVSYVAAVGARRFPDRLLITAHVLDGAADRKLWAEQYEFPPESQVVPPDLAATVAAEMLQRLRAAKGDPRPLLRTK